ncbi:MAG TPA: hypothetical protein PKC49_01270 [Phycisphaerae bacterium]|nr:hypothetical protein [Phycisphaerae bacterium]
MSTKKVPDPVPAPQADPFADLGKLRLSQDFAATVGVKRLLTTVPIRKPTGQEFIRVHSDDSYRLQTAVLELKEEREVYLIAPELWPELPGELKPVVLFTAVNRQGVTFLWPVKLPGEDGRVDEWNRSALEAADHATSRWIRMKANMSLGAYEIFEATGDLPEPQWPDADFTTLLRTGFRTRFIDSIDHPVIRRLRGEA